MISLFFFLVLFVLSIVMVRGLLDFDDCAIPRHILYYNIIAGYVVGLTLVYFVDLLLMIVG